MSQQITTAFVNQFKSGLEIQFQQNGSKLRSLVRNETQNGEYEYFDRIGKVKARQKTSRHSDVQYDDTPHSRRRNQTSLSYWADLIDKEDRVRMLSDPTNPYAVNGAMAIGREVDLAIVTAARGTAYAGKAGETPVAFDSGNIVAVDYTDAGGGSASNLNVPKLREARFHLEKVLAIAPEEKVTCVITASQRQSLLASTQVTSADYNSVRALVNGEVNTFLGFNFVLLDADILPKTGNNRSVLCFTEAAIVLGTAEDLDVQIERLATKHYSTQVYCAQNFGATRLWEEKVVEILCDETKKV